MELTFDRVSKQFGSKQVLINNSFTVSSGSALGLLGRNGAGKTTSIRILLGIIRADGGQVLLDGKPLDRRHVSFGYLPEERGLYPKKQVLAQMQYIGMLKGLSKSKAAAQSMELLRRVRLSQMAKHKLEQLSKGNQQKVQLATALLGDPKIVVLDEPFSGLDPVNAQLLKELVLEQAQKDKIVIFSSHQMGYVEEFCENIALLHGGRIILQGRLSEIKKSYPRNRVAICSENRKLPALLQQSSYVQHTDVGEDSVMVTLHRENDRQALLMELLQAGVQLESFAVAEPSLEEIFVEKAGDDA